MSIPEEAVEAAAKELDSGLWRYLESLGTAAEGSAAHASRQLLLGRARRILEAAAPSIAEDAAVHALRGAAATLLAINNPYDARTNAAYAYWLCGRADKMEAGA